MEYLIRISFSAQALRACLDQVYRTLDPERTFIAHQFGLEEPLTIALQRGFVGDVQLHNADVSHSTIRRVYKTRGHKNILESTTSETTGPTASMASSGLRSVVCAPILTGEGQCIGVIYADDKRRVGAFAQQHADWLTQLAKALGAGAELKRVSIGKKLSMEEQRDDLVVWKKFRDRGIRARKIGNIATAEKNLLKALAFCRYKEFHGLILAKTLNDLSEVKRLLGHLDEAAQLSRECIDLVETSDNIQGLDSVPFYNNFAGLLFAQGKLSEAKEVFTATLKRLRESHGEQAGASIPVLSNLGTLCLREGDKEAATQYHKRAADLAREIWGEDDPVTLRCRQKLRECDELSA